jgi:hypothetical protein
VQPKLALCGRGIDKALEHNWIASRKAVRLLQQAQTLRVRRNRTKNESCQRETGIRDELSQ